MVQAEQRSYAQRGGTRALTVDIYRPDGKPKAAVLMFHGGGWRRGGRDMMAPAAKVLAEHGFVAFGVEYRLLGEAVWPAQIQDVRSAMRWVRRHADELNFPADRIVLQGFSAGAHLALMAAGLTDEPGFDFDSEAAACPHAAAVIAVYPPVEFSLEKPRAPGVLSPNTLLGDAADAESARRASPTTYVDKSFPPTFLIHGAADRLVPVEASLRMYGRLREAGVPVEMHLISGQAHGFLSVPSLVGPLQHQVVNFLQRTVVDPAGHTAECLEFNRFAREDAEHAGKRSPASNAAD